MARIYYKEVRTYDRDDIFATIDLNMATSQYETVSVDTEFVKLVQGLSRTVFS